MDSCLVILLLTIVLGELFLGQPSGGLDNLQLPALLEDITLFFIYGGTKSAYPWLPWHLLARIPVHALQHFVGSGERIREVSGLPFILHRLALTLMKYGKTAVTDYTSRYGRDSGRRDLLTKIVGNKTAEEAPMSEPETHIEISNLVFAGTGKGARKSLYEQGADTQGAGQIQPPRR